MEISVHQIGMALCQRQAFGRKIVLPVHQMLRRDLMYKFQQPICEEVPRQELFYFTFPVRRFLIYSLGGET